MRRLLLQSAAFVRAARRLVKKNPGAAPHLQASIVHAATTCSALLLLAAAPAVAGAEPAKAYRWEEAAKKRGINAKDRELLAKNKILVTNQSFRQVFTPYISSEMPIFITSDSLLNGFHVLFEESILRLEQSNARKLPEILRSIWKNLATAEKKIEGKPELVAAAKLRAQVMIGIALNLLGDDSIKPAEEAAALIRAEVQQVTAAKGEDKPKWLGPPDLGFVALDYNRYKPRGFYTRSPALQRYFRAVSWLQSIPFRVSKDEELLSILLLGACVNHAGGGPLDWDTDQEKFFQSFRQFIGTGDDWDILTAASVARPRPLLLDLNAKDLDEKRQWLTRLAKRHGDFPRINDQLRFPPDNPNQVAELSFRIVSAYRTPDAVLFQRTTDLRNFKERSFPSGLEVCTALGSSYARSKLPAPERKQLLTTIDACKPLFSIPDSENSSLYLDYLHCLATLLDKPEPDAPDFMCREPWQIKSCQTVLGGWAQLRHTWVLQAKDTSEWLNGHSPSPGFVEPVPEFFARLGRLCDKTEAVLRQADAFEVNLQRHVASIRDAVRLLEDRGAAKKGYRALEGLSKKEQETLSRTSNLAATAGIQADQKNASAGFYAEVIEKLKKLADDLENGRLARYQVLLRYLNEEYADIAPLWRKLTALCYRLEALAHKQLRGIAFNAEESRFLKDYGEQLAAIMFYGGNAYILPKDDAPRVADVFSNPLTNRYLEVGIGRARAFYVLYPVKDREILCRGAVLPYYEFQHLERLNDAEWKALLNSEKRPDLPAWVKPIMGTSSADPVKPKS